MSVFGRERRSTPKVVVQLARCQHTRASFGMRIEEQQKGVWGTTWAFPISEAVASREGYGDPTRISGSFLCTDEYPGCPACAGKSFVVCGGCGKVSCWDQVSREITCAWCAQRSKVGGSLTSLNAGRR